MHILWTYHKIGYIWLLSWQQECWEGRQKGVDASEILALQKQVAFYTWYMMWMYSKSLPLGFIKYYNGLRVPVVCYRISLYMQHNGLLSKPEMKITAPLKPDWPYSFSAWQKEFSHCLGFNQPIPQPSWLFTACIQTFLHLILFCLLLYIVSRSLCVYPNNSLSIIGHSEISGKILNI